MSNNKIYRIVQYIQPWEIDDFQRQAMQLINSVFFNNPYNIIWDVTLNTNIVDWNNSKMPKDFFIDKFYHIEKNLEFYIKTEFDTDSSIKGALDKRRSCQFKNQDYVIWLDSDIYFSPILLPLLIQATDIIKDECYILTPKTIKLWDNSWDCIVDEKFKNESYDFRLHVNTNEFHKPPVLKKPLDLHRNSQGIKFGAGWFNLLTSSIFKKIPLVDELQSYGPDDTYIMYCGNYLNIPQYLISDILSVERNGDNFLSKNYIKPFLDITINNRDRISDNYLGKLINDFIKQNS